jgi:hypothetical protein
MVLLLGLNAAIVSSQTYTWMPMGSGLNNGTNGNTYAVTLFNGKMIYGGSFTYAGGVNVNNIAACDPVSNQWSALGTGISGEVKSLIVYNNELYAAGEFSSPGNNIAKWNGTSWQALGPGTDGEVNALMIFNNELAVGGDFQKAGGSNASNIAKWNGSTWGTYGTGVGTGSGGDRVNAVTVFSGMLVVGGRFDIGSGNNVAKWNGSVWSPFNNNDFYDDVQALEVFNSELYVGGKFESVQGTGSSKYIVKWGGSAWQSVGGGLEDGDVEALKVYKNTLVVAGNFRVTGTYLYVDRIAVWTGSQWQRMLTGMNDRVYALNTVNATDTVLYAAGEFTSAGGKWSYHTAKWGIFTTSTVSGSVLHEVTLQPVTSGLVKAVRFDVITREVVVVDSASIAGNGNYTLTKVPKNDPDVRILAFPDDEDNTIDTSFVPTYYPSVLIWTDAVIINPQNNLTGINITVKNRNTADMEFQSLLGIKGSVFLNILPPPIGLQAVPYLKNSLIYLEQNGSFVTFTQTNEQQAYSINGLNPGTYLMRVMRLGYEVETRLVVISSQNLTENFTLDTMNPIGITGISTNISKEYSLKQNYPNPFNPLTNIEFNLPVQGFITLKVFNILGREIKTLVNGSYKAGVYRVDFDASGLSSGIYFYRLQGDAFADTKKMILIK